MKSRKNLLWAIIGIVAVACLVVVFLSMGGKEKEELPEIDENVEASAAADASVGDSMYEEGAMVEDLTGVKNFASALDGVTMMAVSQDTSLENPEIIVWENVWDETQQFEIVPEGKESRYRIYPVKQETKQAKCLELDEASGKILVKDKSDSTNQLFRIIYAGNDMFLIQAYNENVLGFCLNEDGSSNGPAIITKAYEEFEDSRFEKWLITEVTE